jgi:uncharacterized protein with WD repeat
MREKAIILCILTPQKQNKSVEVHFLSLGFTETISQLVKLLFDFD